MSEWCLYGDDIREKFEVVCNDTGLRIIAGVFVAVFVIGAILGSLFLPQTAEKAPPEDTNVYLNEEVCFAKDIYIKVVVIIQIYNNIFQISKLVPIIGYAIL